MSKILSSKTIWVIMSKDRKLIAKGTPRNRELVEVSNLKDKKRFLTYTSQKTAIAAFTSCGFYGQHLIDGWDYKKHQKLDQFLEAVEINMVLEYK